MTTVPPPAAAAAAIARLIASLSIVTPSPLAPKSRTSNRRPTGGTATTDDGAGDAESVVPAFRVLDAPEQATHGEQQRQRERPRMVSGEWHVRRHSRWNTSRSGRLRGLSSGLVGMMSRMYVHHRRHTSVWAMASQRDSSSIST